MPNIVVGDTIVKLLICIAVNKRGFTDEELKFLRKMEKQYFPEED